MGKTASPDLLQKSQEQFLPNMAHFWGTSRQLGGFHMDSHLAPVQKKIPRNPLFSPKILISRGHSLNVMINSAHFLMDSSSYPKNDQRPNQIHIYANTKFLAPVKVDRLGAHKKNICIWVMDEVLYEAPPKWV